MVFWFYAAKVRTFFQLQQNKCKKKANNTLKNVPFDSHCDETHPTAHCINYYFFLLKIVEKTCLLLFFFVILEAERTNNNINAFQMELQSTITRRDENS